MRRKKNPSKAIFDEIFGAYKHTKPTRLILPKQKSKINHTVRNKRAEIRKLEKTADALFQMAGKIKYPYSIISGKPVEVIHHFVPKSQSNNLRYDFDNAIPLTNGEHFRHHNTGDPSIVSTIIAKRGLAWSDGLNLRRHIPVKETKERLEKIIEELSVIVYGKPKQLPWE